MEIPLAFTPTHFAGCGRASPAGAVDDCLGGAGGARRHLQNSPKVSTSPSGKPEGSYVDLIEAIADKEGWKLDYVRGTWSEGLARMESGEIDLMPDVALTPEREQLLLR